MIVIKEKPRENKKGTTHTSRLPSRIFNNLKELSSKIVFPQEDDDVVARRIL